jgi:nicotinamide-nucleotide amidase
MWSQKVLPRLCQSVTGAIIVSKTFKTFGLSEAKVDEMVSPLLSSPNPTLGVYAKIDGIHLRLTAKAQSQKHAEEMIASGEARLRSILGRYIWGTDGDTLESVVGRMLSEKGLSLAVMEGYTGGLLGATITNALNALVYFKGGLIAGSGEAQKAFGIDAKLISDCGFGSAEAAQAMAEVARLHLGADIGVGIAGVDEPSKEGDRPVGTIHIRIDDGKSKKAITTRYPGDRTWVKRRVVNAALFELSKILATA